MKIEINTHNWNEIEIKEVAQLFHATRRASPLWRPNQNLDWSQQFIHQQIERFSPSFVILARSEKKLVGMTCIITTEPTIYDLWRWHPIVLPGINENEIAASLIKAGIDQMHKAGVHRLEVCFDFSNDQLTSETKAYYQKYNSWYKQRGIVKLDETVYMTSKVSSCNLLAQHFPKDSFEIKSFSFEDKEKIYDCFYQAFLAGKDRSFLGKTEEQRRLMFNDYFDNPESLNKEASLILLRKNQVIGFSVFNTRPHVGDEHLAVFCIHPNYQGRGLGKTLLSLSISKITQQGEKLMSLGVDVDNVTAYELYKKNGFKTQTKLITHVWKTEKTT